MIVILVSDLRPLRIPLHSKTSKRCPTCTHILIKPEQKAQSVRYKIKLVAANYLPAITIALPHLSAPSTKKPKEDGNVVGDMLAGKTYAFHLALTNPLYDPIQVRLSVQRMHVSSAGPDKARRPPFAISLPTTPFPIAAFAEAWEYEDDEDMFGADDDELGLGAGGMGKVGREKEKGKSKTVGVLEKKANLTIVGGEVVIGKEARGNVKVSFPLLIPQTILLTKYFKFNMLVSYTYRSDDPSVDDDPEAAPRSPTKASGGGEVKTFSFYTVVDLGGIVPREQSFSPAIDVDF